MKSPLRAELQFGLFGLMSLTVAAAVFCALLFAVPNLVAVPCLIFLAAALPAALTVLVIHTRGYGRTFCIGALFPAGLFLYATGWLLGYVAIDVQSVSESFQKWIDFCDEAALGLKSYAGVAWLFSGLSGVVALLVRLVAESQPGGQGKPSSPFSSDAPLPLGASSD
jgi:lysylphosphatidylglycerol synthetase-like protein (DUF2156 family)